MKAVALTCVTAVAMLLAAPLAPAASVNSIDAQITSILAGSGVSGNTWTILMQNKSGSITYYQNNPTTPRRPASNTKIYTTAGAFGLLGPTYTWSGGPLQTTISPIMLNSDNAMADDLCQDIGYIKAGSYSFTAGCSQVMNWVSGIGIDMTGAVMQDGSGLDYDNRFTAKQTISVVRYMLNNYPTWDDYLPVGCVSGTLGSRYCGTGGSGNVHAKTGTLPNGLTVSLSGYVNNPNDGQQYLFSCISNNATDVTATQAAIDAAVVTLTQSGIPNDNSNAAQVIVDNGGTGYAETGTWGASSSVGYYGGGSRYADTGTGSTATWTPTIATAGNYAVYAWWVQGSNRANNATFAVTHAGGTTNVVKDQTASGGQWVALGTYAFNGGTAGKVVLSNAAQASKVVSADAMRFVYAGPTSITVDNTDAGFTASANWIASTSTAGYLGTNYKYRNTQSISDAASWSADLTAGSYKVYARWTAGTNRAASAPYQVVHTGGTTTVNVNQQANNGTWVLLGTFNMAAGNSERVRLSCWTTAGFVVVADGVKFEKQ